MQENEIYYKDMTPIAIINISFASMTLGNIIDPVPRLYTSSAGSSQFFTGMQRHWIKLNKNVEKITNREE